MKERFPVRYIVLSVIAVAIAAAILISKNIKLPNAGEYPTPAPTGGETPADPTQPVDPGSNGIFAYELDENGNVIITGFAETFKEAFEKEGENINYPCFTNGKLIIPATIDGKPVISVGSNAFQGDDRILELEVAAGVKNILDYAFETCEKLEKITLPQGLKVIDECAFFGCSGLTKVEIPASVKTLAGYAFKSCDYLAEVSTPITAEFDQIFEADLIKKVIVCEGTTSIAEDAFYKCAELEEVVLPESIASIKDYAFAECSKLVKINFPKALLSIGANAFEQCTALTEVKMSEGLTLIGEYAFSGCTELTSVVIPESVVTIGERAFDDCEKLTISAISGSEGASYAEREEIPVVVH